jgi:hypothetical protein
MLNTIIQILLAIFLLLIMAFIAYSIYDNEYIRSINIFNSNKKETKIFTGIYPYDKGGIRVETVNRLNPYYIDLNPSINQNGGAEYSYNFWIYFNITDKTNNGIYTEPGSGGSKVAGNDYIVLFYRGVSQLIPYKQFNYACDTKDRNLEPKKYILVKNPLVKMSNDGKEIVIEYNNLNTPDTFNSTSTPMNCTVAQTYDSSKNKLGIKDIDVKMYNKVYNMITIVMQESPSNEDVLFQNRTNCKVYFNGTLIADRSTYNNDIINDANPVRTSTVMKKNIGNLYINPKKHFKGSGRDDYLGGVEASGGNNEITEITESDDITKDIPLKMANLSYFNYALTVDEILVLYNRGFSKELADIITKNNAVVNKDIVIGKKINMDMYSSQNATLPVEPI